MPSLNFKSIKIQLNLFLAAFACFLFLKKPTFSFASALLLAVIFSVALESILLFLKTKKIQISSSAITSGLIIGLVFSDGFPWWMFLAIAFFTMVSKRIFRFRGKNLLNPAAFGIFLAVFLLNGYTAWKGAYLWYILIPIGIYIVSKIKKTELILSYFITSLALFIPQTLLQQGSLWDIPGYFNYFFIFIMFIEPKTTPARFWPKILFGTGVALCVFILTHIGFRYEPELFALLLFNLFVPWLDKIPNWKIPSKQLKGVLS